jgi:hypothetical protein
MAASLLITKQNAIFFLKEISIFFSYGSIKVKDQKLQEYTNLFYN